MVSHKEVSQKDISHIKPHLECTQHALFVKQIKELEEEYKEMRRELSVVQDEMLEAKVSTKTVITILGVVTPILSTVITFLLQSVMK